MKRDPERIDNGHYQSRDFGDSCQCGRPLEDIEVKSDMYTYKHKDGSICIFRRYGKRRTFPYPKKKYTSVLYPSSEGET